jgi:hypothetical protein
MLNKLDDFPIHQTPEPLAHPATSEHNAYDRTWFNGFAADGSYYFAAGMAIYPHRGVLDCAFSVLRRDGRQHCFYASRRAPAERTEMQAGPFRIEVLEPMRRSRIVLEENESGISCDLEFSTRTAGIEEARQTLWSGPRRIMDNTRFDLFGRWRGRIVSPDGEIQVAEDVCHGMKDRSWGFRGFGEPAPWSPPAGAAPQTFFLWAPLIWDDHVTHAIFFDNARGEPLLREAITAPLYASEAAVPGVEDGRLRRLATARHRVDYQPGSRCARRAELDLVDHDGSVRTIGLEPILKFQMKGLGYGHPEWGHARWKGELATGHESFDPRELDPLDRANLHTQQVVRATDGTRTGLGVLEQICLGPYAPAGFTEALDGAKG